MQPIDRQSPSSQKLHCRLHLFQSGERVFGPRPYIYMTLCRPEVPYATALKWNAGAAQPQALALVIFSFLDVSVMGQSLPCDTAGRFITWLHKEKVAIPRCGIGSFSGTGRGVVAQEAISCGEVVVSVPDDAALLPDSSCIAEVGVPSYPQPCTSYEACDFTGYCR